ncbi:ankyrin repeat-containing domain protein [Circinella umbellata]|nr:ankyrin repeat-containing domain protein [Circinella umbellata]
MTALLKAAYAGHMSIVEYLVNIAQANTFHQDKDGWSVLHNACSSGHLSMVRFLVESHVPVNVRSRIGNTPLINAASKGDIAVVEYLLNETEADPLLCNKFGETAYDAAAAIGHVYLCELLEAAERSCWVDPTRGGRRDGPYNSLSIHITIPVLIHENQRSIATITPSLLLKRTSNKKSISFSSTALNKNDSRKAWSLYPSGEPTTKSHVKLPPLERTSAWFWLTDWTIDYSHPNTDHDGWQYSKGGFDTDEWTPVYPTTGTGWVRRRRWMRIMKRRVDNHLDSSQEGQVQEEQVEERSNNHNTHVIPPPLSPGSSSSSLILQQGIVSNFICCFFFGGGEEYIKLCNAFLFLMKQF